MNHRWAPQSGTQWYCVRCRAVKWKVHSGHEMLKTLGIKTAGRPTFIYADVGKHWRAKRPDCKKGASR